MKLWSCVGNYCQVLVDDVVVLATYSVLMYRYDINKQIGCRETLTIT